VDANCRAWAVLAFIFSFGRLEKRLALLFILWPPGASSLFFPPPLLEPADEALAVLYSPFFLGRIRQKIVRRRPTFFFFFPLASR